MSKIKKALERSKAHREQRAGLMVLPERELSVVPEVEQSALSERERLERDIRKLLSTEHPEMLESMQKHIKISYSKTRTIDTDLKTLINNRVYALSHDMEISKQIEILKARVLKALKQMNASSLMITSANHREGKTFISTNLATSIAKNMDRTVMLVDADIRIRSYKHQKMASVFFNSASRKGLSEYLSGTSEIEDLLINPGIPRLTVLPSGKALSDSAELLGSPKMEELICDMKSRYSNERVLIFDCSSFLPNADPLILSGLVDAVLLVVENERTETKALERMIELLKDKKIVGAVINRSRVQY